MPAKRITLPVQSIQTQSAVAAGYGSLEPTSVEFCASIVVCTYNRCGMLAEALHSLQSIIKPERGRIEILVVDNASTDETADVVAECAIHSSLPVRYVKEPQKGVAFARNRGLEEATGTWVAFFDDDQLADPAWLVQLLAAATQHATSCVGGTVRLSLPEDYSGRLSGVCRVLLSESPSNVEAGPYRGPRTPGTGNMLVNRALALRLGGFDTEATMGGEDTDLYRRICNEGVVAWYEPSAIIYHRIPKERLTDKYMLWNARRTGVHVADIEYRYYGPWKFVIRFMLRIAQACLRGPKFWWRAYCSGDQSERLGGRCVLVAAEGYVRRSAQRAFPGILKQEKYFEALDFRTEREQFGS